MRYCCKVCEDALTRDDAVGLRMIVAQDTVLNFGLVFALEYRAVAQDDISAVSAPPSVRVLARHRVCIRFCPWCGKELRRFYSRYSGEMNLLSQVLEEPCVQPDPPCAEDASQDK